MNFKGDLCVNQDLLSFSNSGNFDIIVVSNNQNFISQILRGEVLWEKSSNFSVPWDLKFKAILIWELQESSSTQSDL